MEAKTVNILLRKYRQIEQVVGGMDEFALGIVEGSVSGPLGEISFSAKIKQTPGSRYGRKSIEVEIPSLGPYCINKHCFQEVVRDYVSSIVNTGGNRDAILHTDIPPDVEGYVQMENNTFIFEKQYQCPICAEEDRSW